MSWVSRWQQIEQRFYFHVWLYDPASHSPDGTSFEWVTVTRIKPATNRREAAGEPPVKREAGGTRVTGSEREVISEGRDISGCRNGEIKRPRVVLFMARYYAICHVLAATKVLVVMEMWRETTRRGAARSSPANLRARKINARMKGTLLLRYGQPNEALNAVQATWQRDVTGNLSKYRLNKIEPVKVVNCISTARTKHDCDWKNTILKMINDESVDINGNVVFSFFFISDGKLLRLWNIQYLPFSSSTIRIHTLFNLYESWTKFIYAMEIRVYAERHYIDLRSTIKSMLLLLMIFLYIYRIRDNVVNKFRMEEGKLDDSFPFWKKYYLRSERAIYCSRVCTNVREKYIDTFRNTLKTIETLKDSVFYGDLPRKIGPSDYVVCASIIAKRKMKKMRMSESTGECVTLSPLSLLCRRVGRGSPKKKILGNSGIEPCIFASSWHKEAEILSS